MTVHRGSRVPCPACARALRSSPPLVASLEVTFLSTALRGAGRHNHIDIHKFRRGDARRGAWRGAGGAAGGSVPRPPVGCGPVRCELCVTRHVRSHAKCCHTKHKPYYHTHINHTAHREIAHRAYTEHTPDGRARTQHTHRTTQAPHKGAPRRGHSTEHLCHAPHSTPLGYTLQHRAPAGTPT